MRGTVGAAAAGADPKHLQMRNARGAGDGRGGGMISSSRLGTLSLLTGASLLLGLAACKDMWSTNKPAPAPAAGAVRWLDQGWSATQQKAWYQPSQGSRLMPWAWAKVLERAEDDKPFFELSNLAAYRFITVPGLENPQLPVGFAIDEQADDNLTYTKLRWFQGQANKEQWLGLNCAACHTANMDFDGKPLVIDGGPSLVDFQSFIEGVDGALNATLSDPGKFDRFAKKVLAGRDNDINRGLLKGELQKLVAWERENGRLNKTDLRYGYGRLDAFGHIFNKVAQLAVYGQPAGSRPATANAADAPVSYPFLWDIYRQSQLQWNGVVVVKDASGKVSHLKFPSGKYLDYSALGRNAGEVIGVFGDVDLKAEHVMRLGGFPSSIQAGQLNGLEGVLRHLKAPKWPGAIDQAKAAQGKPLFEQHCAGCHTPLPAGDDVYDIRMVPLRAGDPGGNNTDPWMACNAVSYESASGWLAGRPGSYLSGDPIPQTDGLANLLKASVVGSLVNKWPQIAGSSLQLLLGIEKLPKTTKAGTAVSAAERKQGRLQTCFDPKNPNAKFFAYKARSLDGIWATAPYLHDGSVPTLYDLLLPPDRRPTCFFVGTRRYDPVKVGYATGAESGAGCPVAAGGTAAAAAPGNLFRFDTAPDGNRNVGHDYKVGQLTEAQRLVLLEYLKTL
jgi:mono/diheme cytochrome c family protein